ncbi:hypothetical protein D3C73_1066660 [compost metagenome]
MIRRLSRNEALQGFIPLEQQPLLASDVQRIAGRRDGVEVETLRVVGAILERRPALTTVVSSQNQVEHADRVTHVFVGKPYIQQRFVGALLLHPFAFGHPQRPLRVVRLGGGQRLVMLDQQSADLAPVQLFFPGLASVVAVQHHAVAAHCPALGGVRKAHCIQISTDRHLGLLPLSAAVIAVDDVATLAHRNQALARPRRPGQRAADRQGTGLGWQVQHIDIRGGLADALCAGQ